MSAALRKQPIDVIEALRAGRYENKIPYDRDLEPVDENKMTVRQAREHVEEQKQLRREQRTLHQTEEARLRALFKEALENEHDITGHPKADKLFDIAWSEGHSEGYESVAYHYRDLAELLT